MQTVYEDYEIAMKHVSMVYGAGSAETAALSDVSLRIGKGEFISLLGPSGCGKTTLLRIVADLIRPTAGTVTVRGESPREARLKRRYGIVFQNPVLYDWRSVRRNIRLPLEILRLDKEARERRVNDMMELVGLEHFADYYPGELSGGMQQRVGIARALALQPEILLMDEPFSALDEFTREKLQADLLDIWSKTDKTVIFVTHNIAEAVFLSDRVVVLSPRPGRLSAIVDVDLPRPRRLSVRDAPAVGALVARIRGSFEEVSA